MTRTLPQTRRQYRFRLATVIDLVRTWQRHRRDDRLLDESPQDRLLDMGIRPRTKANMRHSGEPGQLGNTTLW